MALTAEFALLLLSLAGIPWLVRWLDGRLFGDRLGRFAASGVCAALLFGLVVFSGAFGALLSQRWLGVLEPQGGRIVPAALFCAVYWAGLWLAWAAAARLKQRTRTQ